ncbi:MAG: DMT family transporter [Alcanivoracaceae bacterium]|nr:DMT family transporter [Alcanivoracaceae bacterium]
MTSASKADVLLLTVTLMASISWMFSKEAVSLMPPLLFVAIRFLLAGSLLALAGWRQLRLLSAEQVRRAMVVGLFFGTAMCCWIMGLHFSSHIGVGAFLTSLAVVLVPVFGRLAFAERAPASTWLALPVAVAGLALLSLEGGFSLEAGQLFFVAAAVIFAFYFNLNTHAANHGTVTDVSGNTRHREKVPALALTTVVLWTVGALASAASLTLETWPPLDSLMLPSLAGWVAASAIIGTAGRFFIQTYAQSLSPNSHGVVIMVVEPVWTALMAAAWFGERMSLVQLAGCALIFTALLVNRWRALRALLKTLLARTA